MGSSLEAVEASFLGRDQLDMQATLMRLTVVTITTHIPTPKSHPSTCPNPTKSDTLARNAVTRGESAIQPSSHQAHACTRPSSLTILLAPCPGQSGIHPPEQAPLPSLDYPFLPLHASITDNPNRPTDAAHPPSLSQPNAESSTLATVSLLATGAEPRVSALRGCTHTSCIINSNEYATFSFSA